MKIKIRNQRFNIEFDVILLYKKYNVQIIYQGLGLGLEVGLGLGLGLRPGLGKGQGQGQDWGWGWE